MAKNRNKTKPKNGADLMEISVGTAKDSPPELEAMDTSEGKAPSNPSKSSLSDVNRKVRKGVQMKRSKNLRKLKAVAKAIASSEKSEEKVSRTKTKTQRILSAKTLYD